MKTELVTLMFLTFSFLFSVSKAEKGTDVAIYEVTTLNNASQEFTLVVTPSNRDVVSDAGSTTFSISSNTGWTISDDADWLTLSISNGNGNATLSVTFTANTLPKSRIGTIAISGTGVSTQVVTVTQKPFYTLSVSRDQLFFFGCNWDRQEITVTSNTDWTATVDPNAWWLNISPKNGNCDGTIVVEAMPTFIPTDIETFINIILPDGSFQAVHILQFGTPMLMVDPSNQEVSSIAGSTTFNTYPLNGSGGLIPIWSVTDDAEWLTVSPGQIFSGGQIIATFTDNPLTTMRVGTILLFPSCGIAYSVTVTQKGSTLTGILDSPGDNYRIYPNPAKNKLFIEGCLSEAQVSIYDLQGKLMLKKQLYENNLDISTLEPGGYTIMINDRSKVVVKIFIKKKE